MSQDNSPVVAVNTNSGLKHFIIGKLWLASEDGSRTGAVRISRDLPRPITIQANTILSLTPNKKREGQLNDADYSVSVLLPVGTTNALIEEEAKLVAARKAEEAQAAATVDPIQTVH